MPIQVVGQNTKYEKTKAYATLYKHMNLHPENIEDPNPFYVANPRPEEIAWRWSSPQKVMKRVKAGWRIVTPVDGKKVYNLPDTDIDKGKGCCVRYGQILIDAPVSVALAHTARCTLKSLQSTDLDVQKFMQMAIARDPQAYRGRVNTSSDEIAARSNYERRGRVNSQTSNEAQQRRVETKRNNPEAQRIMDEVMKEMREEALAKGDISIDEVRAAEGATKIDGVFVQEIPDLTNAEDKTEE